MKTKFSLLFYLKRQKGWNKGAVPIYIRITIDGQRAEISTGRDCEPARWDSDAGRASGNKEAARTLNYYLDSLQHKAEAAYQVSMESGEYITAVSFRDQLTGKGEKRRLLLVIFEEHNKNSRH